MSGKLSAFFEKKKKAVKKAAPAVVSSPLRVVKGLDELGAPIVQEEYAVESAVNDGESSTTGSFPSTSTTGHARGLMVGMVDAASLKKKEEKKATWNYALTKEEETADDAAATPAEGGGGDHRWVSRSVLAKQKQQRIFDEVDPDLSTASQLRNTGATQKKGGRLGGTIVGGGACSASQANKETTPGKTKTIAHGTAETEKAAENKSDEVDIPWAAVTQILKMTSAHSLEGYKYVMPDDASVQAKYDERRKRPNRTPAVAAAN